MMKGNFKRLASVILAVMCLTLSGCGNGSADYEDLIDKVIEYNHEFCKSHYSDSENLKEQKYWVERDGSNFSVWEDDNNYYVLVQKNYVYDDDFSYSIADGYKLGKENGRVSSSPDDRALVDGFYQSNETPLYTENNVELVRDDFSMR